MGDPAARFQALEDTLEALRAHIGYPPPPPDPAVAAAAAALTAAEDTRVLEQYRALCIKLSGGPSEGWAAHSLGAASELSHFANNPVPRPPSIQGVGKIYDISETSWGQVLASQLGDRTGFFLELAGWAPIVSYIFDTLTTEVQVLAADDTPAAVRHVFWGLTEAWLAILHSACDRLHVHQLRGQHGAQIAQAFQTQIALTGAAAKFQSDAALEFDRKIAEKVITAQQKTAAQRLAEASGSGARGRGRRFSRGGRNFGGRSFRGRSGPSSSGASALAE